MTNYAHPEVLTDTQWVADHLNGPNVRIVEVDGTPKSYDSGHMPGAVFWNAYSDILLPDMRINFEKSAVEALLMRSGIGNHTTVVFYSNSYSATALAFWYLKAFGHRDVRLMNGSRKKWVAEGRPLTTEIPAIKTSTYAAQEPDLSMRAMRAQVEASIGKSDRALVDTRRIQEYSGEWFASKPPEGNERAGHIPGAAHIYFELALNEDGTFKSAEALQVLYDEQGVTADKEVITYCTLGWRAGHTWLVLKYLLGYPNVRNYDGSWNEWGRLPDTPIEQ